MGFITPKVLAQAIVEVHQMSAGLKEQLLDEIHAQQPNLLHSVLALTKMGASVEELEVPLHILLVTFQSMKRSGHRWPLITEGLQEQCLSRLVQRMKFNEDLPAELTHPMIEKFHADHPERYLLAATYDYLRGHKLNGSRSETEKYIVLAILNLVECVATAGSDSSRKRSGRPA